MSKFANLEKGKDYVVLPLYGFKNKQKFVHEKSGLNQWNGKPRPTQSRRGLGEFYLKIPKEIHKRYSYTTCQDSKQIESCVRSEKSYVS